MGAVDPDDEIGRAVAVDVALDIGVALHDLVAQLAGRAREGVAGDEGEAVVGRGRRLGIDVTLPPATRAFSGRRVSTEVIQAGGLNTNSKLLIP